MTKQGLFDKLTTLTSLEEFSDADALQAIGSLIDVAGDLAREEGTARALKLCDALEQRPLTKAHAALLEYFRANAWATRRQQRHRASAAESWAWEQRELQKEVFHLRRALNHPGFPRLSLMRRTQVLTNLGNLLSTVGRFVEAAEYWDRGLALRPGFGMALGNRGCGLGHYARALYDPGHQHLFLGIAYEYLGRAVAVRGKYDAPHSEARAFFQQVRELIQEQIDVKRTRKALNLDGYNLGRSKDERRYRRWCLEHRLFLNPLNDLGAHTVAARDILVLPSYVTPIGESPTLIGFFNQIKQEFVSARWLFFAGSNNDRVHFSDRGAALYNTLDCPAYSLAVEQVRAAFRISYSLFDKVAAFLNDYLRLGIRERDVYFRGVWYEVGKGRSLWPQFAQAENWPFRGLYWLAKDFAEQEFRDIMEPDAQALSIIRNRLEHGYVKVHEWMVPRLATSSLYDSHWIDRLAYSVTRSQLEDKTLRLLKLARAALIYLSLGMHREERRRRGSHKHDERLASMSLDLWPDSWKR
jgi:tetratricopeptide (TPR) repeat protein